MSKSKVKTMIIVFFNSKGIMHKEFVPPGQTVNQQFYLKVLDQLRKRIVCVRPGIAKTWVLNHDNAACHRAFSVTQFLSSKKIPVLPQPHICRICHPILVTPSEASGKRYAV